MPGAENKKHNPLFMKKKSKERRENAARAGKTDWLREFYGQNAFK